MYKKHYNMATIGVKETTLESVKKLAKMYKISNGEVVEFAANFFLKNGLDLKEGYSIKAEIKKNNDRLHQVIGVIKEHERVRLTPAINGIVNASLELKNYVELYKPNRLSEILIDTFGAEMKELKKANETNKELLEAIVNHLRR